MAADDSGLAGTGLGPHRAGLAGEGVAIEVGAIVALAALLEVVDFGADQALVVAEGAFSILEVVARVASGAGVGRGACFAVVGAGLALIIGHDELRELVVIEVLGGDPGL